MSLTNAKIVYLTAGAGGMFCGSCMHDNALAKSLSNLGFDIQLVPTYTPIRTDESDFCVDQVFFGGINVYLQQQIPWLRWLPGILDRFLDNPRLIRRVASRSMDMPPEKLGKLAVSMLHGIHGNQRKEVSRLCRWLIESATPDVIVFSNALIGGCIPELKRRLRKPIIVTLQGDDVFLDSLPQHYRDECIKAIASISDNVDGFVVHTEFYKNYMADYFGISPNRIHVTPLGIDVDEYSASDSQLDPDNPAIGYLARIAPEKGFHKLIESFIRMKKLGAINGLKLRIAGWLGPENENYFEEHMSGIPDEFRSDAEYLGQVDRAEKIKFLSTIDVLSVPTVYQEPKGLYALEAMACGVPIVQPNHGAFPELIAASNGGLLYEKGDTQNHCDALTKILLSNDLRTKLGGDAKTYVTQKRNSRMMGLATAQVIRRYTDAPSSR